MAVWLFQAPRGNGNVRQAYFWVRKSSLTMYTRGAGRGRLPEKACWRFSVFFCPLPGLLPELVMEWAVRQIKVTLIQIIQKCETPNHAWSGQKIRVLPFLKRKYFFPDVPLGLSYCNPVTSLWAPSKSLVVSCCSCFMSSFLGTKEYFKGCNLGANHFFDV